ncbi:hypothetical protein KY285_003823 [Solanum tuberosum]|nr:hypothetical protein KY284_001400 [Solanum tuberosum]KAH0730342.1 hypothetical protein KY289_001530 [Solanum tuberosum]KAH0767952.1 hypothetical protein KY285_003823 [Solanum tuberosum]
MRNKYFPEIFGATAVTQASNHPPKSIMILPLPPPTNVIPIERKSCLVEATEKNRLCYHRSFDPPNVLEKRGLALTY